MDDRSNVFYSSEGNPEVWETKPDGYFTEEEWKAAHPEPPIQEELNAARRAGIISRLAVIDQESIRPLRALAKGTTMDYDREKLVALESEAVKLREELEAL